jgi:hypothetical protein
MITGDLEAGLERFTQELPRNAGLVAAWLEAVTRPEHRERLRENQLGFIERMDVPRERAHAIVTLCDGLVVRYLLHGEVPPVRQMVKSLG